MKISARIFLVILLAGGATAQNNTPLIRRLPVEGFVQLPAISPDGERVAFSREQYSPVEVLTLETSALNVLCTHPGAGWGLVWLDNTHLIVRSIREEAGGKGRSMGMEMINVLTKTEAEAIPFASQNRLDVPLRAESGVVIARNRGQAVVVDARGVEFDVRNVKDSEVIWSYEGAAILSGNTRIASPGNRDVLSLSWSPDGSTALVELLGQPSLFLFSPATGEFTSVAARGERPSWVDTRRFVYMETTDDGHSITDADIYLGSVEGSERLNLTASFTQPAMNPSATRDDRVVFNTPNGELYLLELGK